MPPSVTAQPGVSLHSWSQPRVGKVEFEPSTKCSARRANELNFPHARGCVNPAQSSFPGHYSPGTALPRNSPPEPQINQHIFSLQLQPHLQPTPPHCPAPKALGCWHPWSPPGTLEGFADPFGNAEIPPDSRAAGGAAWSTPPNCTRNEPPPPPLQRGTAEVFQGSADTSKQLREQACLLPGSWSSGTTTSSSGSDFLTGDRSARAALPTQGHVEQHRNHPEKRQQSTTRKTHHQRTEPPPLRRLWNQTQIYCKKHYGIRGKKKLR